ncbi:MAG: ABC transporter ATP-binding protein [Rhodospirillales bacterium]
MADALPPDLVLRVEDLRTWFDAPRGTVRAVDGVDLEIRRGRTLAVVGESGSGKSVTSLSIMRLLAEGAGRIAGGRILYRMRDGRTTDLAVAPIDAVRAIRGREIGMIFQEPMTSLNPLFTVGDQIGEGLRLHERLSRAEARVRAVEMLRRVEIPAAERRVDDYPHQMSGGMRQRVLIALALACNPALLIADEPTTALDVTIQAQILDLLRKLQAELGMSILFITHNLGVVAEIAHEVAVMYAGRVVEQADARTLFAHPRHPYTRALLACTPRLGERRRAAGRRRIAAIPGTMPSPLALPPGCAFAPRCDFAEAACEAAMPTLRPFDGPTDGGDAAVAHLTRCRRAEALP